MSEAPKTRFLAVVHTWFVNSRGWHVHEINTDNRGLAEAKADHYYRLHNEDFIRAEVKLIELRTGEELPKPRKRVKGDKLTLFERITGRIWSDLPTETT